MLVAAVQNHHSPNNVFGACGTRSKFDRELVHESVCSAFPKVSQDDCMLSDCGGQLVQSDWDKVNVFVAVSSNAKIKALCLCPLTEQEKNGRKCYFMRPSDLAAKIEDQCLKDDVSGSWRKSFCETTDQKLMASCGVSSEIKSNLNHEGTWEW